MSSSAIIFVFCRLANVMEFITGYFFMKCIDCTMTVSYTHLDVYKRQVHGQWYF